MGVPFYSYPGWGAYSTLIANDPSAITNDMPGTYNYHNGVPTMQAKTAWAMEYGLGGMMIWELSHDSTNPENSLIRAIYSVTNPQICFRFQHSRPPVKSSPAVEIYFI